MPSILLIRHAQASYGGEDYDVLSDAGHRQAEILASALAARAVDAARVISGSLRRQLDTAVALVPAGAGAPTIDARWDEYDAEDVIAHHSDHAAGLTSTADGAPKLASHELQPLLDRALAAWIGAGASSGCRQTWPEFAGAGRAALEQLTGELGRGETAIVVTSAGVIAAICASLLGDGAAAFVALNRVGVNAAAFVALNRVGLNAAITKLTHGSRGTSLVSFNDHSHLESVDRALLTYR